MAAVACSEPLAPFPVLPTRVATAGSHDQPHWLRSSGSLLPVSRIVPEARHQGFMQRGRLDHAEAGTVT